MCSTSIFPCLMTMISNFVIFIFQKLVYTIFTSVHIMLNFYASKWRYCGHWKTWWNMFAYFCCRRIFRIIFTSINLFYYTFKIWINNIWCFISFCYWFNSNILISSKRHFNVTKKIIFHILFYAIQFFFLLQKNEGNLDNKNHHDVGSYSSW